MTSAPQAAPDDRAERGAWPATPLLGALLPLVMERVAAVGEELRRAAAGVGEPRPPGPTGGGSVEDLAREGRELGWMLGVLGAAAGTDVMGKRREPRGLDLALAWTARAAERAGRPLSAPAAELPRLANEQAGWELPWLFASALYALALDAPAPFAWHVECAGAATALVAGTPAPAELRELAAAATELGAVRLRDLETGCRLTYSGA